MFSVQGVKVTEIHEISKWFHFRFDEFLIFFWCNEDFIVLFDQVLIIDWTRWGRFDEGCFDKGVEEFLSRGNSNETRFSEDFCKFGFDSGGLGSEFNVGG